MAYVNLSSMPSAKKEYSVDFETLAGGLNLQELDYRIGKNESPEMKNMLWREGVLSCRDGQVWVIKESGEEFHSAYEREWNGKMFIHAGNRIYMVDKDTKERIPIYPESEDNPSVMNVKGKFFAYNERLYYKTKGYYIVIEYDAEDDEFTAADVVGYSPVTVINADPKNGSGDMYQPENRLSPNKTIWYSSAFTLNAVATGAISVSIEDSIFRGRIVNPGTYVFSYTSPNWKLNGTNVNPLDYGIAIGGTPVDNDTITVVFAFVNEYYLPVKGISIGGITVEDVPQIEEVVDIVSSTTRIVPSVSKSTWRDKVHTAGIYTFVYSYVDSAWKLNGSAVTLSQYGITYTGSVSDSDTLTVEYVVGTFWKDEALGKVVFFTPPTVYYPEITNTVKITYTKDNPAAMNNIMDCRYAEVYGGTGALCIVMAGSESQPNAYFWIGQNSVSMDATYFPMTQYQLAGDMVDPITGFGKQQGFLIIFKSRSIGRTILSTAEVDGRTTIDLPYVPINAKIGCDLPYTIQLIENNLTWCNTDQGIHFLANTSSAYENNVVNLSEKINNSSSSWNQGLLYDIRHSEADVVVSHDDEKRYWLVCNGHAWLWDYQVSNYKNPAWFYFENIKGQAFVQEHDDIWHFDSRSRLTHFERVYFDYDPSEKGTGAIDKVFRFATQYFGTYDNYKNVNSIIINTRSDTNSVIDIEYLTDYENRHDLTPLSAIAWMLVPRNLEYRNLSGSGFSHVFRRKPHCRRVRYFTMRLENNTPSMDMSIVSAQIYYTYQGRQR